MGTCEVKLAVDSNVLVSSHRPRQALPDRGKPEQSLAAALCNRPEADTVEFETSGQREEVFIS